MRIAPLPNRFVLAEQLEQLWQSDAELLLHLRPNQQVTVSGHPEFQFTVETNSEGLRDDPFVGEHAIAAIGDSFTFGFGVGEEQAWPEQLEQLSGLKVANLGWAGWNSHVYPAALRRHAVPLRAELWLWAFFVNDLRESAGAERFLASGEEDFLSWAQDADPSPPLDRFPYNLRTLQLLAALANPDLFLQPNSGDRIYDDGEVRFRYGPYPWEMSDPSSGEVQRGWQLTEAALLEVKDLAVASGAQLAVIYVPSREHVYWPYLEGHDERLDVGQLDSVEDRLSQFCAQHGIGYINLLPAMRAEALGGQMLYFPNDGHWNSEGHALAARLIWESLRAQGLVSAPDPNRE